MQDTYSNDQLADYGRRLAARLCDQYFAAQPVGATLDGPAVLKLAPLRQLNLFVVQQLLAQWTGEMARLRSPYFDYEDPAVRQALTQLMNLLSRRIRLTRDAYEPLLAQSAADTLRLVLDPLAVFSEKLLPAEQSSATPAQLRDALRYIDLNKALFQDFIDGLPADQPQEHSFLLSRFRLHLDAHYKDRLPFGSLQEELQPLLPLTEAELRPTAPAAPSAPAPETAPDAPKPAAEAAPAAAEPQPAPAPAAPAPPVETAPVVAPVTPPAPEPAPAPVVVAPAPAAAPVPEAAPVAAQPEPAPAPVAAAERPRPLAAAEPATGTLAEKLAAAAPRTSTLAEKLASTATTAAPAHQTLAEAQPKVESLRSAISINQRFSFINELFNGENMEYHAAVEHLDALPSAEAARRYVTEDLAQRYQWVRKDEHVNKLLRLIDRKFA